MDITWLGHGTFQFRLPSGEVIVIDPWTEGNPKYPAGHFDHIHDAVPLAKSGECGHRAAARYRSRHPMVNLGYIF
jgi:L-ascorbate metabolism protein UlaG (beta-lactamase superfamily)